MERFFVVAVMTGLMSLLLPIPSPGQTAGTFEPIVLTGQAAPGGSAFQSVSRPAVNNAGVVAFRGGLTETIVHFGRMEGKLLPSAIFAGRPGNLARVVGYGDAVPTRGSRFSDFGDPAINDNGDIAFVARIGGGYETEGMFVRTRAGLIPIAFTGDPAPGTSGKFVSFSQARLSNVASVAFAGRFDGRQAGDGIFLYANGTLRPVVLQAQVSPTDPVGVFDHFTGLAINGLGQVAFSASLNISNGRIRKHGVFIASGAGIRAIALQGGPSINAGSLDVITQPSINDAGDVAFLQLTVKQAPRGPYYLANGVFLTTNDLVSAVSLTGRRISPTAPLFNESFRQPMIVRTTDGNSAVVFMATDQSKQTAGVWLLAHNRLTKAIQESDRSPLGGTFSSVSFFAVASSGYLAFSAGVTGTSTRAGIFVGKITF